MSNIRVWIKDIENHTNRDALRHEEIEIISKAKGMIERNADIPDNIVNAVKQIRLVICW